MITIVHLEPMAQVSYCDHRMSAVSPSGQTLCTLWGYVICTAVFSEVRVRVAWCYGFKKKLVCQQFPFQNH